MRSELANIRGRFSHEQNHNALPAGHDTKGPGLQDRTAVITSSIDARPRQPKSAFTARVIGQGYFYLGIELAPASNRHCVDSFTHALQSVCRFLTVLIAGSCIKRTL